MAKANLGCPPPPLQEPGIEVRGAKLDLLANYWWAWPETLKNYSIFGSLINAATLNFLSHFSSLLALLLF